MSSELRLAGRASGVPLIVKPPHEGSSIGVTKVTDAAAMAGAVELAARHAIPVLERPFSIEEACQADEAFLSSAGTLVMPVISIDGHRIGSGAPGPLTRRLRQLYIELLLAEVQANEGDKSAAKS